MTDDLLDSATETIQTLIPLLATMGVRVVELAPGRVSTEIPFEGNGNHVGTMYAGSLFTVCEVIGGIISTATFDGSRFAPIVKGAEIRFLRPATSTVRASASLDEQTVARVTAAADADGKADFPLEITAVDAEGTVVATLRGDYQLRKRS